MNSTIDPMIWLGVTYVALALACLGGMAIPVVIKSRADRAAKAERYCTKPCCRGW